MSRYRATFDIPKTGQTFRCPLQSEDYPHAREEAIRKFTESYPNWKRLGQINMTIRETKRQ